MLTATWSVLSVCKAPKEGIVNTGSSLDGEMGGKSAGTQKGQKFRRHRQPDSLLAHSSQDLLYHISREKKF